jgi:hypothetical protein
MLDSVHGCVCDVDGVVAETFCDVSGFSACVGKSGPYLVDGGSDFGLEHGVDKEL